MDPILRAILALIAILNAATGAPADVDQMPDRPSIVAPTAQALPAVVATVAPSQTAWPVGDDSASSITASPTEKPDVTTDKPGVEPTEKPQVLSTGNSDLKSGDATEPTPAASPEVKVSPQPTPRPTEKPEVKSSEKPAGSSDSEKSSGSSSTSSGSSESSGGDSKSEDSGSGD